MHRGQRKIKQLKQKKGNKCRPNLLSCLFSVKNIGLLPDEKNKSEKKSKKKISLPKNTSQSNPGDPIFTRRYR